MPDTDKQIIEHACIKLIGTEHYIGLMRDVIDQHCLTTETRTSIEIHGNDRLSCSFPSMPYTKKVPDPRKIRTYHGIHHLARMWNTLYKWNAASNASAAFTMFHDSVFYSMTKYPGQNETESASKFLNTLESSSMRGFHTLSPFRASFVLWGILASAQHYRDQQGLPIEVQRWLDADLVGLADPWKDYTASGNAVRLETGLESTDPKWIEGRRTFLSAMLARQKIFYTICGSEEKDARANMARELKLL